MDLLRENLRHLMGRKTVNAVAAEADIEQSWLQRVMNPDRADGIKKPGPDKLGKLAAYFGVQPAELMFHNLSFRSPSRSSQTARPDPAILAQTQEFLETAFAFQGKAFDLRTDPDLFADAYEWLAEDERPIDERNLVHFGRWLAGRHQANEAVDEDEGGRVAGKIASTHRGRAARTA